MNMRLILQILLFMMSIEPSAALTYAVYALYTGSTCNGTPYAAYAFDEECTDGEELMSCSAYDESVGAENVGQWEVTCATDYIAKMREFFSNSHYILEVAFNDTSCSIFYAAYGVPASGNCEGSLNSTSEFYIIGSLNASGTTSIQYFNDTQCSDDSLYAMDSVDATSLEHHTCNDGFIWYSSDDPTTSSSGSVDDTDSGLSTGAVVGIICGCIVVVVIIVGVILYRRRSKDKHRGHYTTTLDASSLEAALSGQTGLWNDDVITAKRIPRDKVKIKKLISRGAYGEVYNGVFNGQPVAVKMLLPSTRGSLQHVTDFLTEAKMTASMDHPHIVTFIGVAWDSLSDLCVVLEFMDGGDLRMLLNKYEATKHPVGFDKQKTTIALHVCHALTYLHSLMPPVIHRDLKSRNILLNHDFEAKLTDFGISRERLDQTMTAGVGTSLWMAPEVMLGEKYDVKVDTFSFGVVLSELDVHTLPYAPAKQRSLDTSGRKMADATLLQKITAGEIQVDFSESSPRSLVDLGLACVAIDSNDRPTAAEALYRLQVILAQELAG